MKRLSGIVIVMLLVVLSLTLTACMKEPPVIGKWSMVLFTIQDGTYAPEAFESKDGYIDFEKGNRGILNIGGEEYPFDWEIKDDIYIVKLRYEGEQYTLPVSVLNDALYVYNLQMIAGAMATCVKDPSAFKRPADARLEYVPSKVDPNLKFSIIESLRAERANLAGKKFSSMHIFDTGVLRETDAIFSIQFNEDGTGEMLDSKESDPMEWRVNPNGKLEIHIKSEDTLLEGGFLGDALAVYEKNDHSFVMVFAENPSSYSLPKEMEYLLSEQPDDSSLQDSHILFYDGWVRVNGNSSAYSDYENVFVDCFATLEETEDGRFLFSIFEGPVDEKEYEPVMTENILQMFVRIDYEKKQLVMVPANKSNKETNFLFHSDLDTYEEPFVLDVVDGKIHFKKLFVDEDKDYIELEFFLREDGTNWLPGDTLPPSMQ